jgi:hypothetical protein
MEMRSNTHLFSVTDWSTTHPSIYNTIKQQTLQTHAGLIGRWEARVGSIFDQEPKDPMPYP